MAMHEGGTKIQDPWRKFLFPVDPVLVFSDAAGVEQVSSSFKGMGVWEEISGNWLLSGHWQKDPQGVEDQGGCLHGRGL